MRTLKLVFPYIIIGLGMLALWNSCAQVGSPSGGPRDTIPPEVLNTEPPNYSTNFNATSIEIEFNEYYQIKNRQNAVMVSPPMEENPRVAEKGKTLQIKLQDTLRSNVTYTFDFGENISDLNEGNPLGEFKYVVSTGETIDSLRISGYVVDAFTYKPPEETEVYLYKQDADSLPRTRLPLYWAKTGEQGNFTVRNIAPGSYKIFALKDANRNQLFDVQSEAIAFLDTLLVPSVKEVEQTDSLQVDTTGPQEKYRYLPDSIHLRMFTENNEKQYLKSSSRPHPGKCLFVFNKVLDSLDIAPITLTDSLWGMQEKQLPNDSLIFWARDTSAIYTDSLLFELGYMSRDSLDQPIHIQEEAVLLYDTAEQDIPQRLNVKLNTEDHDKLSPRKQVTVHTSTPVRNMNTDSINLFQLKDSLEIPQEFTLAKDSAHLRRHFIKSKYQPGTRYKVQLLPGAFTGWYGNMHDTTTAEFSYIPEEEFGNLQIAVSGMQHPGIFQLLKTGGSDPIRQQYVLQDTTIQVPYLQPGKYQLQMIEDVNGNERWDTGNYEKHRQPEFLYFFGEEVTIKAGWDNKLQWELQRSVKKRETEK